MARFYSSTAGKMALTSSIDSGATSIGLDKVAGLPNQFPYTLVIEPGLPGEEIVTVNSLAGLAAVIVRGVDGSTATGHTTGAEVRHMATARDFREPQDHIAATADVHGITGSLAGATTTQTLTNKTISGLANTITNILLANVTGLQALLDAESASRVAVQQNLNTEVSRATNAEVAEANTRSAGLSAVNALVSALTTGLAPWNGRKITISNGGNPTNGTGSTGDLWARYN